jgi:hypothetical protein
MVKDDRLDGFAITLGARPGGRCPSGLLVRRRSPQSFDAGDGDPDLAARTEHSKTLAKKSVGVVDVNVFDHVLGKDQASPAIGKREGF